MGQVVIKVNGRDFALRCADGQEGRLRQLAQFVDAKVGQFAKELGQIGEARLLLLAAIAIADELSDANDALGDAQAKAGASDPVASRATASSLDAIAERIESIAARVETP